jgi:hypothetical protein
MQTYAGLPRCQMPLMGACGATPVHRAPPLARLSIIHASPRRPGEPSPPPRNLEPFKPETPKTALYLVRAEGRLTLQVVGLGLAHFRLPVRSQNPLPGRRRQNRGGPCGGALGGGSCQTPRWRRRKAAFCSRSSPRLRASDAPRFTSAIFPKRRRATLFRWTLPPKVASG